VKLNLIINISIVQLPAFEKLTVGLPGTAQKCALDFIHSHNLCGWNLL